MLLIHSDWYEEEIVFRMIYSLRDSCEHRTNLIHSRYKEVWQLDNSMNVDFECENSDQHNAKRTIKERLPKNVIFGKRNCRIILKAMTDDTFSIEGEKEIWDRHLPERFAVIL